MTLDEFLTLPLPKRIVWLHSAEGPRGKLSHDAFARILGTTRQTVINWERGAEPRAYAEKLAEFSGFPADAFLRRGAEVAGEESSLRLLRELRAAVDASAAATAESVEALARGIERIEQRLDVGAGPRRRAR